MKNASVKKSLKESKNALEEKRRNGQAKNLHKKDQHVYNNWYELRSRAIKKGQTKNQSSEKLHKKDHTTNIIATNFAWEQQKLTNCTFRPG